jgi:biotin carboxyl carrier protein
MCGETDVAELEVRLGSFELRVVRAAGALPDSGGPALRAHEVQVAPGAPTIPAPAPGTAFSSTASMDGAYALATASLDGGASSLDEDDEDATTLLVGSPKVGILRRGRYVKGKRVGKALAVEEGTTMKKGQVLAYIEQLGTFAPVEAPQAGELIEFLVEDGDPVEFRQPVVEFAPFFGGHIIGDSKHA